VDSEIRQRLTWVKLDDETHDAGFVCRRCGISRLTLCTWLQRYQALGEAGLVSQSRRPKTSPRRKVVAAEEVWILALRHERHLGARRIQHELARLHACHLSLETIQKVLGAHHEPPLRRPRRPLQPQRYAQDLPWERVKVDTYKIAPGRYQDTAADDRTRYVVIAVLDRRTAADTLRFLEQVREEMPFPIQRFQTDNRREFTAYRVQDTLKEWRLTGRPIRPRSLHLNGKGEWARVQSWPSLGP
jgi:transposase InsO family protein